MSASGKRIVDRLQPVRILTLLIVLVTSTTACGAPTHDTFEPARVAIDLTEETELPIAGASAGSPGRDVEFRRLTINEGLSQSSINCIAQDAQGFMWFGTQDGLNRYDGYEFKVYRHDPEVPYSLANNYVMGCERDRRGVVWIVTRDGTLQRYEPETARFVRYDLALDDPFQRAGTEFTSLYGDKQGRLWIGTFGDGLIRYDPDQDQFTYYRHAPNDPTSLSHRMVSVVYEDREGVIWVGTEGGLNRYDQERDAFVRYPYRDFPPGAYQWDPPVHDYDSAFQPDNPHALASPGITRIIEDDAGRLWVGTRYGGLNRLDRDTGWFEAYPFDPSYEPEDPNTFSGNSVRVLHEDRRGHIWVGSAHWNIDETRTYARLGLERLEPETERITRYTADPEARCSLPHEAVNGFYEDNHGTLWLHTFAGGIEIYDRATGCFVHHAHDPNDERSLSGDGIADFYEDSSGGLWIGTAASGVNYYDPTWAKFRTYRSSAGSERLSNNSIWRIALSPSNLTTDGHADALWISTFAGVNYWDRRAGTFTFYEIDPTLPDILAYGIFEDAARDVLWLGTSMGLEKAKLPAGDTAPEALNFTRVLTRTSSTEGLVGAIYPAEDDQLWLARYEIGLSRFNPATEEIVLTYQHDPDDETSLGDARVTGIFPGWNNTLWLLSRSGVDHFDPATATFTHVFHDPDEVDGVAERVLALYQDRSDGVWLGTDGEGLQRLDPVTGRIVATYQEEEGLPNSVVYAILPDENGHLWLSTNRGVARFDPETETFEHYTVDDGLQSNEFNMGADLKAPDGELFLGGIDGVNAFYSDEIAPNPFVPPVVVTEILLGPPKPPRGTTVDGAPANIAGETVRRTPTDFVEQVELSYRDRILSFEFAALHYAMPERNQYAYKMEGFDREWNYVGNRRYATYTNLPPGRYTFRVKGSNSDGLWNDEGAAIAVVVTPPFWATWWFRGVIGLLIVSGAVAGYRVRVRSVEARSRDLERQVTERTKELAAVNAIAAVVSRSLDLGHVLTDALDTTLEVMGVEAGGIYLLDEEAGLLTIAAQRGFSPDLVRQIDRLRVGEGFSGQVAETGEALVVRDISEDPRLTRMAVQDEGLSSLAVVPLRAKDTVLGTLFAAAAQPHEFGNEAVQLLIAIGNQIGVAVENAGLYQDTRRRLAQVTALQETTMAVASTLELGRLLRLIIQQATDLMQAGGGILNLVDWNAGEDEVVAATGSAAASVGLRSSLESSLSGWATLHGETVTSDDLKQDNRVDREGLDRLERESGQTMQNAAVAPLVVKDQVVGTLVLIDKEEGQTWSRQSDLELLQTFANQAATAIENARLFESEQRRAEQFRIIGEVGSRITSILDIDELLNQLARLIQEAFGYYHVGIGLVEGGEVVYRVGAGKLCNDPLFQFEPATLKVGSEGITGWVAAIGEPILVPDVSQDPRYVRMRGSDTRSELIVPLKAKGQVIGVLDVQSDEPDAFDESDLLVLQSLAHQAAIAIENARLYEQARRLAVVEERQRLARELHDSVTQALYGVTLYAEATARQLTSQNLELAGDHLRELRETAQEALREMRLLIFELRPSALEREGLVAALRSRLESVEERAGLGVSLQVEGNASLPAGIEEGLYRIAQEALNNALKHACAENVSVYLYRGKETVILDIVDDGVGFDPITAAESGGLGLESMMERADRMTGKLTVHSEPGAGTHIRVEVPQ